MTTDHTNDDETPEAPPDRAPGWYWVRLKHNRISGEPGEWTPHFVHPVGDGGVQRISVLHEWGPRIDPPGQPAEPPPLPDGWRIDVRNGVSYLHCGGYSDATAWVADGQFVLNVGHVIPESCARHLLGLTAPAADVRALTRIADRLEAMAAAGGDVNLDDGGPGMLALAAQLHGLTGKGAPL